MPEGDDRVPVQPQSIPVRLTNGVIIHAEATPIGQRSTDEMEQDVADRPTLFETQDFRDITKALEGIASEVSATLERVGSREASIEFGLEVGVEAGKLIALLVKGTGKANLKITLTWKRDVNNTFAQGGSAGIG
jgi:hypothetical protein